MEEVTRVDNLRALVQERDEVKNQYNNAIAAMIRETALTAMFQLFELASEAVEWAAIDIVDESLIVVVKLTYTNTETTPHFLKMMDVISNAGPNTRTRTLRVGLPLDMVFSSHDEIKQYLITTAENLLKRSDVKEVAPQPDFDPSALSPEQLKQLVLYKTMQKAGDK